MIFIIIFLILSLSHCFQVVVKQANIDFLVCLHAGPPMNPDFYNKSLDYISELGANGVRTDVLWGAIEPEQNNYSQEAIQFYKTYFQSCKEKGLDKSILIFSSPPDWAKNLWKSGPNSSDRQIFLTSWAKYIDLVMREVGLPLEISKYQVWNEPNALPSISFWGDIPSILKAGGQAIKKLKPDSQIYVNPNCNLPFWTDELLNWCEKAGDSFTGIGVDHYPGTWAANGWDDWYPLDMVINMTNTQANTCFGKIPTLMETGYSSFSKCLGHDEFQQNLWIEKSLDVAFTYIKKSQDLKFSVKEFVFYELYDEGDESTFPPEEAHFGLIRNNGSKKIGFDALKEFVKKITF